MNGWPDGEARDVVFGEHADPCVDFIDGCISVLEACEDDGVGGDVGEGEDLGEVEFLSDGVEVSEAVVAPALDIQGCEV